MLRFFISSVVLVLFTTTTTFSEPPPLKTFTKPISFSILEDYDKNEDLNGVAKDFELMTELGVSTWRGSFGWDDYEPERGAYDFQWLHKFADLAAKYGIKLRPYIAYTPEWSARKGGTDENRWNNPPASLDQWGRFVGRLAGAMARHENVLSYEIYLEEDDRLWWDGSIGDYAETLKAASTAIRRADKDAQVLLGGLVYANMEWIEAACGRYGAGSSFAILPFHAYPETWTPPGVEVENYVDEGYRDHFLPAADKACGKKPIWINEAGFATSPGKTERDQATWWVRAFATFIAAPRIEHLGIYEIKEPKHEGPVIGEKENYFLGLTYNDRRKKLAFHTVKMLVALFNTKTITVADPELTLSITGGKEGNLYRHLFIRPDGKQILVLWDKGGNPGVTVSLSRKGSSAVEYALDGRETPFPFDGKSLRIILEPGTPRIIVVSP